MGNVQALTDQMISAGLNTQAPTSEKVLHEEADVLPSLSVSKPLQKTDPDIYSGAQTLARIEAAKDATVKNPLMQISTNKLYAGNPNIGRSTAGSWTRLYDDPKKKKIEDSSKVYNDRFVVWIRENVVKEDLSEKDLEELSTIGIEQPKLVEAYPELFEGAELDKEIETATEEKTKDLAHSTSEQHARRERIKVELSKIYNEMPDNIKNRKIKGAWRELKGTVISANIPNPDVNPQTGMSAPVVPLPPPSITPVPPITAIVNPPPVIVTPPKPSFVTPAGTAAYNQYLGTQAARDAGITPAFVEAINANVPTTAQVQAAGGNVVTATLQNIVANPTLQNLAVNPNAPGSSNAAALINTATSSLIASGATVPKITATPIPSPLGVKFDSSNVSLTQSQLDTIKSSNPDVYNAIQKDGLSSAWGKYGDVIVASLNAKVQADSLAAQQSALQFVVGRAQALNIPIKDINNLSQTEIQQLIKSGISAQSLVNAGITPTAVNNAISAINTNSLNTFLTELKTQPQVLQDAYNNAAKSGGVTAGLIAYDAAFTSMKQSYSQIIAQLDTYYSKTNQVQIPSNSTSFNPMDAMASGITKSQWTSAGLDPAAYDNYSTAFAQLKPYSKLVDIPTLTTQGGQAFQAQTYNWQQFIASNPTQASVEVLKKANFPDIVVKAAQSLVDTVSQKVNDWSKGKISTNEDVLITDNAQNLGLITDKSAGVVRGFTQTLLGSMGVAPNSALTISNKEVPNFFNSLTKDQQQQLAVAVINDPNAKNSFATFMEGFNTQIKANPSLIAGEIALPFIPFGMIASSALMIANTAAKASTGQPVSTIEKLADAASVVLATLSIPVGESTVGKILANTKVPVVSATATAEDGTTVNTLRVGSLELGNLTQKEMVDFAQNNTLINKSLSTINIPAGKIAYYALLGGAVGTFGTELGFNWNKMTNVDRAIGVAMLTAPLLITILPAATEGIVNRANPTVVTGTSLALSPDVDRPINPQGMSLYVGRQLIQDAESLQMTGTLPANRLRSLSGSVDQITNIPNISNKANEALQSFVESQSQINPDFIRTLNLNIPININNLQPNEIIAQTLQNVVSNPNSSIYDTAQAIVSLKSIGASIPQTNMSVDDANSVVNLSKKTATVQITKDPNSGTTDLVLKSADGNIIAHVSGAQRVMSLVDYHNTPNTEYLLNILKDKGYIEIELKDESGELAHRPGLFASQQSADTFMYDPNGTPSPGKFAIRFLPTDYRNPPQEVLDQPRLKLMKEKMFELDRAGKLEKDVVYPLTKGYQDSAGLNHFEYETYIPKGSKLYSLKADGSIYHTGGGKLGLLQIDPNSVPHTWETSQVGFEAPTSDSQSLNVGQRVPIYWVGFKSALDVGIQPPSPAQMYQMKLLGDLTTIRQYAPWNIRGLRIKADEDASGAYTANPLKTAITAIQLQAVPEDKSAGRVSAIVHNQNGEILLTRTLGQERYDLPGGGVVGKSGLFNLKAGETIDTAMQRELWEEVGLAPSLIEHVGTIESSFNPNGEKGKFQLFDTTIDVSDKVNSGTEIAEYVWWDGKSELKYPVAEFVKDALVNQKIKSLNEDNAIVNKALENAGNNPNKLSDLDKSSSQLVQQSVQEAQQKGADVNNTINVNANVKGTPISVNIKDTIVDKMNRYNDLIEKDLSGRKLTDAEKNEMNGLENDILKSARIEEPMTDEQAVNAYLQSVKNQNNIYYRGISSIQEGNIGHTGLNFDSNYDAAIEYVGNKGQLISASINSNNPVAFSELMKMIDLTEIENQKPESMSGSKYTDYIAKWDNYVREQAKVLGYDAIITSRGTHYEIETVDNDIVKEIAKTSVSAKEPIGTAKETTGNKIETTGENRPVESMQPESGLPESEGRIPYKLPNIEDMVIPVVKTEETPIVKVEQTSESVAESQNEITQEPYNSVEKLSESNLEGKVENVIESKIGENVPVEKTEVEMVNEPTPIPETTNEVISNEVNPVETTPYQSSSYQPPPPPYIPPPPEQNPPPPPPPPPVSKIKVLMPLKGKDKTDMVAPQVPPGSWVWVQGIPNGGAMWKVLPPPYHEEDMYTLRTAPIGAYKFPDNLGKGLAYRTFQIIGKPDVEEATANVGWTTVTVTHQKGNNYGIKFGQNSEANVGERQQTIGMGEGQIPIEVADAAKAEGISPTELREKVKSGEDISKYQLKPEEYPEPMDYEEYVQKVPTSKRTHPELEWPPSDELGKQLLPEYSTGKLKVYEVNGDYIRSKYADTSIGDRNGVDFAGAGHSAVYYRMIPKDEIWVEKALQGNDRKAYVLHELKERDTMLRKKIDYDTAHGDYANPIEIEGRKNPDMLDALLAEELAKYPVTPRKRYNNNYDNYAEETPRKKKPQYGSSNSYLGMNLLPVQI